jgi:hypothetical protein
VGLEAPSLTMSRALVTASRFTYSLTVRTAFAPGAAPVLQTGGGDP